MPGYLLDTNLLSELLRKRPDRRVKRRLNMIAAHDLFTSSITVMELRRGVMRVPGAAPSWNRIERDLLPRLTVLPFDQLAAMRAGDVTAALEVRGEMIDLEDIQIAGIALAEGLVVSTRNVRHFRRVEGLRYENWFDAAG